MISVVRLVSQRGGSKLAQLCLLAKTWVVTGSARCTDLSNCPGAQGDNSSSTILRFTANQDSSSYLYEG